MFYRASDTQTLERAKLLRFPLFSLFIPFLFSEFPLVALRYVFDHLPKAPLSLEMFLGGGFVMLGSCCENRVVRKRIFSPSKELTGEETYYLPVFAAQRDSR